MVNLIWRSDPYLIAQLSTSSLRRKLSQLVCCLTQLQIYIGLLEISKTGFTSITKHDLRTPLCYQIRVDLCMIVGQ